MCLFLLLASAGAAPAEPTGKPQPIRIVLDPDDLPEPTAPVARLAAPVPSPKRPSSIPRARRRPPAHDGARAGQAGCPKAFSDAPRPASLRLRT
jgi:hypothetical protein